MGVVKYIEIHLKLVQTIIKVSASWDSVAFLEEVGRLSHDVAKDSRDVAN
jgi:hypothetical protein